MKQKTRISAFYLVTSLVFYTVWYANHVSFLQDARVRHDSLIFWTGELKIRDLLRDQVLRPGENQIVGPERLISYPRMLSALALGCFLFAAVFAMSISPKVQIVILTAITLINPNAILWYTHGAWLPRFIPLIWGSMIGLTVVLWAASYLKPWGVNPTAFISQFFGKKWERVAVISGILGLPAIAVGVAKEAELKGPSDWFLWCFATMVLGSIFVVLGLGFGGALRERSGPRKDKLMPLPLVPPGSDG